MSLWELSAGDLLDRAASGDPTPGGGSVAAIAGALGLGLVCMALEVSVRRADAGPEIGVLLGRARTLLSALRAHPDADVAAFESYMAALALPKVDADRKARRREAVQRATHAATAAPLAAARDLLAGLELTDQAAKLAHRSIVSDVGAGAHLLSAALQATLLNVDINLESLPVEAREAAQVERSDLARQGLMLSGQVMQAVSGRLVPAQ